MYFGNWLSTGTTATDSDWRMYSVRHDPQGSVSVYANGALITSDVGSNYVGPNGLQFNEYDPEWSYFKLAELVAFNRSLTLAQLQQVEGTLMWKFGLQSKLPSNHMYSTTAPVPFFVPSATATMTSSLTPPASASGSGTVTSSGTATSTTSGTVSATSAATGTALATTSATASSTSSGTATRTAPATVSSSGTAPATATPTRSAAPTVTATGTSTSSSTASQTASSSVPADGAARALSAWLRLDDLQAYAPGTCVSGWTAVGSAGASAAVTRECPVVSDSTLNGYKVVNFTNAQSFRLNAAGLDFSPSSTQYSIVYLAKVVIDSANPRRVLNAVSNNWFLGK